MFRPEGDLNAGHYVERQLPQLVIDVARVDQPLIVLFRISAPEQLQMTEMPSFIAFAAGESFDSNRDTVQIFRRRLRSDENEVIPIAVRSDVPLKAIFTAERHGIADAGRFTLFYDIIRGYPPERIADCVIRTVEIYNGPVTEVKRVRVPMEREDGMQALIGHIRANVYPCEAARLLLDVDGLVRLVSEGDVVEEAAILRFDVIPDDQVTLGFGEYLVVISFCRFSKTGVGVPVGRSFLFKIVPSEVVDDTRKRLAAFIQVEAELVEATVFRVGTRLLNGDERLDHFAQTNDVVSVILPHRTRTAAIFQSSHRNGIAADLV
jgi:hypothetical protein